MIVVGFIILFVYVFFLGFACIGLIKNSRPKKFTSSKQFTLSIIVPVRNEMNRIDCLLNSLEKSKIDNKVLKEIIFVNDHSEDDTILKIEQWKNRQSLPIKLLHLEQSFGKKKAIVYGAQHVTADFILTLDADTNFNTDFLQKTSSQLNEKNKLYVVPVIEQNGLFLSRMASHANCTITIGLANFGFPINCNGAALIFDRITFLHLHPFQDNYQITSGDDLFTLNSFVKHKRGVQTIQMHQNVVLTDGAQNLVEFLSRGVRWSGKMKHIHLPVANLFGFTILLSNFFVYYFLGKCLFTESYFPSLIWLLIKLFIDFISVFSSFTLYNKKSILKYTLPMYFMYPIYLFLVLFLNLIPIKFEWKNRPVLNLKTN